MSDANSLGPRHSHVLQFSGAGEWSDAARHSDERSLAYIYAKVSGCVLSKIRKVAAVGLKVVECYSTWCTKYLRIRVGQKNKLQYPTLVLSMSTIPRPHSQLYNGFALSPRDWADKVQTGSPKIQPLPSANYSTISVCPVRIAVPDVCSCWACAEQRDLSALRYCCCYG